MNGSDHELDDLAPGVEPQEFHASHLTYTVGLGLEVLSRCGSRCRTGERKVETNSGPVVHNPP